jgi:hypothetical protein
MLRNTHSPRFCFIPLRLSNVTDAEREIDSLA